MRQMGNEGERARIAMWSGPRNISTAMMRSWGARPDCVVVDEPLYAFYLTHVDIEHPGRDEIIHSQPTDWQTVVDQLTTAELPGGATVFYQKHMTHHVLPDIDRARLAPLRHAFLIRDPLEVLRVLRQGARRADPGGPRAAPAGRALRALRRPGGRFARPAG